MREVVLLVGVPGSGKTWCTNQLGDKYDLCLNDDHIGKDYIAALLQASAKPGIKKVLGECPFSISAVRDPLIGSGRKVSLVFIIEEDRVVTDRYFKRDKKPIPPGHLSRQKTYRNRAQETSSFSGTSSDVAKYLKERA